MPPNNEIEHPDIEQNLQEDEEVPRKRKSKVFQILSVSSDDEDDIFDDNIRQIPNFRQPPPLSRPQSTDHLVTLRRPASDQNTLKPETRRIRHISVGTSPRLGRSASNDKLSKMRKVNTISDFESLQVPSATNTRVNPAHDPRRVRHYSVATSPGLGYEGGNNRLRRPNTMTDFEDARSYVSIPASQARQKKVSQISNRNGNMVIQLVLPGTRQAGGNQEYNNNLSVTSNNELGNNFKRRQRHASSVSQPDTYSNANDYGYANSAYNGEEYEVNSEAVNIQYTNANSEAGSTEENPTSPEEKNRMFREYLTKILSCVYALFIVTLGLVVYISDVIVGNSPIAETFSSYLVIIAFIFLVYLIVDVRIYMNKRSEYYKALRAYRGLDDIEFQETPEGELQVSFPLPDAAAKLQKPLPHHYCLSTGRHSGSFYLKIGAAGFCLGHLVHSGLIVGYQIVFLTSDGDTFYECASVATLILDIIYPIYSFLLLYFIFKYSNVIINRHVPLARFGLMHCISSSICFWIWTILRETVDSLSSYASSGVTPDSDEEESDYGFKDQPIALPLQSYSKKGAKELVGYINNSMRLFAGKCEADEGLSIIYKNYSPYLYPFTVEYSILVVGVLFVIWQYIGSCKQISSEAMTCNVELKELNSESNKGQSNLVLHADFHSANKGLFCGIIIIVISVVSIILFFISLKDEKFLDTGLLVNNITNIIFLLLMAITGFFAYRQITKLDINCHPISLLDDILMFICIPAFFLNAIFSILAAVQYESGLGITHIICEIGQMLIQTPLIIDGLRRCSNNKELREQKPGRELVTFLIVCNVALWLTQTFEVKSHGLQDHRYDYYGKVLWTIIGHMTLPLIMFYRFHSSVCLVDIWKYAYEPAAH